MYIHTYIKPHRSPDSYTLHIPFGLLTCQACPYTVIITRRGVYYQPAVRVKKKKVKLLAPPKHMQEEAACMSGSGGDGGLRGLSR